MHMAYLQTDTNHSTDYNYIYTSRVQNSLYVILDLCSETLNTTESGDWISLWFDTDNSRQVNSYLTYPDVTSSSLLIETLMNNLNTYKGWVIDNLTAPAGGLKGIFYNCTSGAKNLNLFFSASDNKTINSCANYSIASGFGTSPNSLIAHKIFEFNITLSNLGMNLTRIMVSWLKVDVD